MNNDSKYRNNLCAFHMVINEARCLGLETVCTTSVEAGILLYSDGSNYSGILNRATCAQI